MSKPSRPTGKKPGGPSRPTDKKPGGPSGSLTGLLQMKLNTIIQEFKDLFKYYVSSHLRANEKQERHKIANDIFGSGPDFKTSVGSCISNMRKLDLLRIESIEETCSIVGEYLKFLNAFYKNPEIIHKEYTGPLLLTQLAALSVLKKEAKPNKATQAALDAIELVNTPSIIQSFVDKDYDKLVRAIIKYTEYRINLPDYIIMKILSEEDLVTYEGEDNTMILHFLKFVGNGFTGNRNIFKYPLLKATEEDNTEVAKAVISLVDFNKYRDDDTMELLEALVETENINVFELIINAGVDIDSPIALEILHAADNDKQRILQKRRDRNT